MTMSDRDGGRRTADGGCPAARRCGRTLFAALTGLGMLLAPPTARAEPTPTASRAAVASAPSPASLAPFAFPADDRELLALDADMRRYFDERIHPGGDPEARLNQMIAALLGDQGLHLQYVADANLSARDTFRQRRGNCLSFSLLTVAVARAYGFTAKFCEVNTYPRWDRLGKVITEIRHVNVQIWTGWDRYELDLQPVPERQAPVASARVVSDARAFAHFYNNVGVFRVADGAVREALPLFDRALAADATASFVWANKGSALRLLGELPEAERCLGRAVRDDPKDLSALSTLASFYTQTGRLREAAKLDKKVERYRLRNPYYLGLLARTDYGRGRLVEADKLLRRAIALKDDEPEFYELRIQVANGLGRTKDAARWTAKLEALQGNRSPALSPPQPKSAQSD